MNKYEFEVWKAIKGYEGLYEVSNLGRVKSVERDVDTPRGVWHLKEKILKQIKKLDGHLIVNLYKNGDHEVCLVHRLVAEAFVQNSHDYTLVHHKNHNPQDNRAENLVWMSSQEHRVEHVGKTIYQYTLDGELIAIYPTANEAARELGFSQGNITSCCEGKCGFKTHKGYKWSYNFLN